VFFYVQEQPIQLSFLQLKSPLVWHLINWHKETGNPTSLLYS
jgi:hypothetical protein